jgi:adenylate cyclase
LQLRTAVGATVKSFSVALCARLTSGAMARAVILRAFERQYWKINLRELYRCERRMAPTRRKDGDIMVDGDDIYGDGVNVAARLESVCEAGGICVSARVRKDVANKVDTPFDDLGDQVLKNIDRPARIYRVRLEPPSSEFGPALALPDKPSIAVLPFTNLSSDPQQEYFSDGITEDIITELSRFSELFVIARNSSFQYKGKSVDVRQVGHELGVRYVLEGSIRRVADRVRITAQLIDTATGAHRWAERYDRKLEDVFAVQDEVGSSIKVEELYETRLPLEHSLSIDPL